MSRTRVAAPTVALLLCLAGRAAVAEDYWSYAYGDFDVTTVEGRGRAVALVHDVARFDRALTRILRVPEGRVPTHIHELAGRHVKELLGDATATSYKFTGFEVTVITPASASVAYQDWGVLFGYTGSLMASGRAMRCPFWYQVGVPEVFAGTDLSGNQVLAGGFNTGNMNLLLRTPTLIPTRILLSTQANDPQLRKGGDYRALFDAESWYLAREILIEGKFREEFARYLNFLRDGKSEASAFAESFKASYEDLDRVLVSDLSVRPHMFVVEVPRDKPAVEQPRQLSAVEGTARLADLHLQWRHRADALRLAAEALHAEPDNELALSVTARASVQDANFGAALAAVDRLDALATRSPATLTDTGEVLSQLARETASKPAALGVDAEALRRRAADAYEHAITLDPEYLRAWAGLAYVYSDRQDRAGAPAFVARAQPVMEKHAYSSALARALATMCARTGQGFCAFLFTEMWRDSAVSQSDLEQAMAFAARLRAK